MILHCGAGAESGVFARQILGNVSTMRIDGHALRSLPKNAFGAGQMPGRLERLSVSNGPLSDLPPEALAPLRRLKSLDLHGNAIAQLKKSQFKGLRDAEVLDLSHNNLTKVDASHFADLNKMSWCNLSHNGIGELTSVSKKTLKVILPFSELSLLSYKRDSVTLLPSYFSSRNCLYFIALALRVLLWGRGGRAASPLASHQGELGSIPGRVTGFSNVEILPDMPLNGGFSRVSRSSLAASFRRCSILTSITLIGSQDLALKSRPNFLTHSFFCKQFDPAITCSASVDVVLGTFARNTVLRVLNLSANKIRKLDSNSFRGMRFIRRLYFSDNLIANVGRGTFGSVTRIGTIDLARNRLRTIDYQMFHQLNFVEFHYVPWNPYHLFMQPRLVLVQVPPVRNVLAISERPCARKSSHVGCRALSFILTTSTSSAVASQSLAVRVPHIAVIDVSENEVTEVQKLAFKDLFLVHINMSHNHISKIEPGAFENCANITVLDMSHNRLESIPRTAFDSSTYATELLLSHNLLSDLSQVPLHNMTGLKILNVSHNAIETIPRNTFPKLYELHTIDLSHNKVKDIWNGVFQTLFSLRFLNMTNNSLQTVKGSTFGALHTLLELDLSDNHISDLNKVAFARLSSLRTLHLARNAISKVFQLPISLSNLLLSRNALERIEPLTTWPTMNSLLLLDLSYNNLGDSLERGSFANLLTLQTLNLANNGLTMPPWECLIDMSTLQYLYLQENNLTYLSKGAFGRLPVVFELNLAHNNIHNISARAFEGLLQLLTLNLTGNDIRRIPNGAFQGLVSLRTLDLSHNRIEKLDNKTNSLLEDCLSLETLPSRNSPTGELTSVEYSGPCIHCSLVGYLLFWRSSTNHRQACSCMAEVNLSHNEISFITRKTFPSSPWIPYRLRHVDLSYNVMPVLTFDITVGTKKLEVLNVSHNMLNEIRKYVLGNLTALRVLDMSHNQLDDLPDKILGPPRNLTELRLSHNRLVRLPTEALLSLRSRIALVDARHNQLHLFQHEMMALLENGTDLLLAGNPLECSCAVRPLKQWLSSQTTPDDAYVDLTCSSPDFLSGRRLVDVTDERTTCPDRDAASSDPKLAVNPDIKFRDVHRRVFCLLHAQLLHTRVSTLHSTRKNISLTTHYCQIVEAEGHKAKFCYRVFTITFIKDFSDVDLSIIPISNSPVDSDDVVLVDLVRVFEMTMIVTMMTSHRNEHAEGVLLKSDDGEISATWFVTTREDVGDFHVMVRDTASLGAQSVYEQDVPYTARSHVVPKLPASHEGARLELCVLAQDSSGSTRRWRASQCRSLDENALGQAPRGGPISALLLLVAGLSCWTLV
ncbi:hypothetical protein PR048_000651 [Dryococelus australis]|uniref:LRRCT domain-containing protein n=1 Tax=Dryococelus australis TaxID=614101 RepID=A0ABQ9IG50_9NEOP|nr:hypothetical protein PR048_000651 [Dryococelus australis]